MLSTKQLISDLNFQNKQINNEDPLVQLSLISIAKKLEIINGIRSIDHHNKLIKEVLIH